MTLSDRERIAALERQVQAYAAELDELRVWYRQTTERVEALEAGAREADSGARSNKAGWEEQSFNFGKRVGLRLSVDESLVYLFLKSPFILPDEYYVALDKIGFLEFIGAALVVLKRMEVANSHENK